MKKHINALYILVTFALVFQIITLVFVTIQFSKSNAKTNFEIARVEENLTSHFTNLLNEYDKMNQRNFNELSIALTKQITQQQTVEREVKLLKTGQEDFSSVIEGAVKGVVAVMTENSVGSGFIITSDGYIVTNYHVVQTGDALNVLTYDQKAIPAEIIGIDRLRDLALLKINGNYPFLKLANSDNLQVGRKVIAIGNPLGLSFTVTEGIISALHREGPNGIEEYIQTDVSLNPGNSGGPLLDTSGDIVGINNFKIGGAESIGFALESNSIRQSINAIFGKTVIE